MLGAVHYSYVCSGRKQTLSLHAISELICVSICSIHLLLIAGLLYRRYSGKGASRSGVTIHQLLFSREPSLLASALQQVRECTWQKICILSGYLCCFSFALCIDFLGGPFNLILYVGLAALSALSERKAYIGGLMIIAAAEANQGRFQDFSQYAHIETSRLSHCPHLSSTLFCSKLWSNASDTLCICTQKKFSKNNGRADGMKHKLTNRAKSSTREIKKPCVTKLVDTERRRREPTNI